MPEFTIPETLLTPVRVAAESALAGLQNLVNETNDAVIDGRGIRAYTTDFEVNLTPGGGPTDFRVTDRSSPDDGYTHAVLLTGPGRTTVNLSPGGFVDVPGPFAGRVEFELRRYAGAQFIGGQVKNWDTFQPAE